MQTPPPFHGYEGQPQYQPQKPKTNGLVILFAILGVLLVCCGVPVGILGFFGFKAAKGGMSLVGCAVNAEMMKEALSRYESAHDGKMPEAATWQTDIGKYWRVDKSNEDAPMKLWKPGGEWTCDDGQLKTGFMFNEDMSGKKAADVLKTNPDAVAIFETKTYAINQTGKYEKAPFEQSPKIMGDFSDERRGWIYVSADGSRLLSRDRSGAIVPFDMGAGKRRGSGVKFNIDTNSSDSNDSKDDNSN